MENKKTKKKQNSAEEALGSLLLLGYSCFVFSQPIEFSETKTAQQLLSSNNLDNKCMPQIDPSFVSVDGNVKLLPETTETSSILDAKASFDENNTGVETLPDGADVHEEINLHVLDVSQFVENGNSQKIELPEILKAQELGDSSGENKYGGTYIMPEDEGERSFGDHNETYNTANIAQKVSPAEEIFVNMGKIIAFIQ